MSDPVLTGLINGIIAAFVTLALAWMNLRAKKQRDRIEKTGLETHSLANSSMTNQLKISALLARRVANLSGDSEDDTLAKAAEQAWKASEDAQPKAKAAGRSAKSELD